MMTLYELSDEDADAAFRAIAEGRYWAQCKCKGEGDWATCDWCRAWLKRVARDNDEGHKESHRAAGVGERYAAVLKRKAVR